MLLLSGTAALVRCRAAIASCRMVVALGPGPCTPSQPSIGLCTCVSTADIFTNCPIVKFRLSALITALIALRESR
uniref:Putative secreted protein n=1 Tax=Anopheles triannulatus TaxID=58253 RepID=A0A2M4B6Y4_9DIPT